MAGLITDLKVVAKLVMRSIKRRRQGDIEAPPNLDGFKRGMDKILRHVPEGIIAETAWLSIPAKQAPWIQSSISLKAGQEVSYFC
jgi:hypothetical protein